MQNDIILKLRDCKKQSPFYSAKYEIKRGRKIEAKIFQKAGFVNLEIDGFSWQYKDLETAKERIIDLLKSKLSILGFNNRVIFEN